LDGNGNVTGIFQKWLGKFRRSPKIQPVSGRIQKKIKQNKFVRFCSGKTSIVLSDAHNFLSIHIRSAMQIKL
jgi:hypothetical protein